VTLQSRHLNNAKALALARFSVKSSEIGTGDILETLDHFHQNRSVIEDFTSRTLSAIPSDFGRLYYVSSLKDPNTGQYMHEGLRSVYSEASVQAALEHCHAELFSRILEMPLSDQAGDLRMCLNAAGNKVWNVIDGWRENPDYQAMCPQGLPDYLSDLFCSNMATLLEVFSARRPN